MIRIVLAAACVVGCGYHFAYEAARQRELQRGIADFQDRSKDAHRLESANRAQYHAQLAHLSRPGPDCATPLEDGKRTGEE